MIEIIDGIIHELNALSYDEKDDMSSVMNLDSFAGRSREIAYQLFFLDNSLLNLLEFTGGGDPKSRWKTTKDRILLALKIMKDREKNKSAQAEKIVQLNDTQQIEGENQEKTPDTRKRKSSMKNRIFIVHGHNDKMKFEMARSIEKMGLKSIILHEQPNGGRTIIEKFTDYSDVGFAVVLLSPDDLGYKSNSKPESAQFRARQNVILELGYFLGKLGRNHVVVFYMPEKNFEMPSDFSGVLYIPFDEAGKWQFDLVRELKSCGYTIDANKLIES